MSRLTYGIVFATGPCFFVVAAQALAQGRTKAGDDTKLAIYLQKDIEEDGIKGDYDSIVICFVMPAKFDKTDASMPASALEAIVKHSKEAGTAPIQSAHSIPVSSTSDGETGIVERYIIGAVVKDTAAAPILCKEIKGRFKLDVPLKLCLAHDVKNHRLYVDIVAKK